ncbi:MAG: hypothetical protein QM805_14225 [Pseudomonas sp.]
MERIVIDLRGLGFDDADTQKILEMTYSIVVRYLEEKAHPHADSVVALGPGWVGIEAYAKDLPKQSD